MRVLLAASFGLAVDNTITPEPGQTALATELGAVCSGWSVLVTHGACGMAKRRALTYSVTALTTLQYSLKPRKANEVMPVLLAPSFIWSRHSQLLHSRARQP